MDDIDSEGLTLIKEIADMFEKHHISTRIIAASIRSPFHVTRAAILGAHIATVPYDVIIKMTRHPLTDAGMERFLKDWENVRNV